MVYLSCFEFRQYTLYGGKREALISMFENYFVEPQEAVGAHVIGTFRDLDDPDRFVWIRGFTNMTKRLDALRSFYGGPVWRQRRDAANATMMDSDNVLLLRPALTQQFAFTEKQESVAGIYGAGIYYLNGANPVAFARFFNAVILPGLAMQRVQPVAQLISETAENNFPALPVRDRDSVFLWLARWPDTRSLNRFLESYGRWSGWRDDAPAEVLPALMRKPEYIRLVPTAKSGLQ